MHVTCENEEGLPLQATATSQLVWAESSSQQCPCSKLIGYNLLLSPPSAILAFCQLLPQREGQTRRRVDDHMRAVAMHSLTWRSPPPSPKAIMQQRGATQWNARLQKETSKKQKLTTFNFPLSPDTHSGSQHIYTTNSSTSSISQQHARLHMHICMNASMCHETSLHASLCPAPTSNHWLLLAPSSHIFTIQT